MRASLEDLARREAELVAALPAGGYVEDRLPVIERAGLSQQWAQVFADYLGLLDDAVQGPEALRRATFLAWYAWNEPYFLTGIEPFDTSSVRLVLQRVEAQFAGVASDLE